MESTIDGFFGNEKVNYVNIKNLKTNEVYKKEIDGVFIFIGYAANSEAFKGQVDINNYGEIIADNNMATSTKGVFVAGDVREKKVRQIATAISDGAIAAVNAIEYIQK